MKHNRRFLGIAFAILSMVITSCTGLLPNQSRRSNSSIENIESSSFEETSSNDKTSSNSKISSNQSSNYSSSDHTTHTFGEWVVIIPPTCTSDGVQRRECSVCHLIEEKTLPANGHTWGEWRTVVSATCLEEGSESRVCVVCNELETRAIPATGHKWSEWQDDIAPTCTEQGRRKRVCANCGLEEYKTLQALGHKWEYVETITEPTCTIGGKEKERCSYCGEEQIRELDPCGHSFVFVDNEKDPMPSITSEGVIKCENCGLIQLFIKASEVTDESKKHLVFDEVGGARFWGRPIGNDVALNGNGDADENSHEAIYNPNQTGDYFEFIFNLSAKEVNSLNTCRLYCDAKPDRWIKENGLDFFARREGDTEWTAGFYTSGERAGQEITDYRYVLFVDDQFMTFDSGITNPVKSDSRGEFVVPYTFHMHEGINKIRLHMSGGYRSTFYNFIFRPYDEPVHVHTWGETVVVDNPTCIEGGKGCHECTQCGEIEEFDLDPLGHNLSLIGDNIEPSVGKSKANVYVCSVCGLTSMSFKADEVTEQSKSHLMFNEEGGARFSGQPIGNDVKLMENGDPDPNEHESIYNPNQTGDYFEYIFDLTAEQATLLQTCRLYCEAKAADYLCQIGDFWARKPGDEDWTPGYYLEGERKGELTTDYRYVLYVDDKLVEFDPDTDVPVERYDGRMTNLPLKEYVMPYTFHLHEGTNKIRLHMSGGYRSIFYNFIFRPYVEPTPVVVNETELTVNEYGTAAITSSMEGLTYESLDNTIATVDDNGIVTGVKAGTATIKVSKEGGYKAAKVKVIVKETAGTFTISGEEGVISPDGGAVWYLSYNVNSSRLRNFMKGSTVTFTFDSKFTGTSHIIFNVRGTNVTLADHISVKVNGVEVAVTGSYNSASLGVDVVIGQATLKAKNNTLVITTISENSPVNLHYIKFLPGEGAELVPEEPGIEANAVKDWSLEEIKTAGAKSYFSGYSYYMRGARLIA